MGDGPLEEVKGHIEETKPPELGMSDLACPNLKQAKSPPKASKEKMSGPPLVEPTMTFIEPGPRVVQPNSLDLNRKQGSGVRMGASDPPVNQGSPLCFDTDAGDFTSTSRRSNHLSTMELNAEGLTKMMVRSAICARGGGLGFEVEMAGRGTGSGEVLLVGGVLGKIW